MVIAVTRDGSSAVFIPKDMAPAFYRAFRSELWKAGLQKDPELGDCILGVKIIALSL